jgi:hypothetical protein
MLPLPQGTPHTANMFVKADDAAVCRYLPACSWHALPTARLKGWPGCMLYFCAAQGLSPLWALSHFGVLLLCAMVALAGMIVALVRFGNTITGLVMSTHQVLGLLSVGEAQALSYGSCTARLSYWSAMIGFTVCCHDSGTRQCHASTSFGAPRVLQPRCRMWIEASVCMTALC